MKYLASSPFFQKLRKCAGRLVLTGLILFSTLGAGELNPSYQTPSPQTPKTRNDVQDNLGVQQTNPGNKSSPLPPMNKTPGKEEYLPICGQSCSYNMAAQAMTVLGVYLKDHGPFANKQLREKAAQNIQNCMKSINNPDCKKDVLIGTLMQYNIGRDTRRMILQNQTNEENIKSKGIDPQNRKLVNALYSNGNEAWLKGRGTWNKVATFEPKELKKGRIQPFKFQIDENFGKGDIETARKNAKLANEREILGDNFLKEYRSLTQTYTKLSQNTFVKPTPYAKGSETNQVAIQRVENGRGIVQESDYGKFLTVDQSMNNPNVRKIVDDFHKDINAVKRLDVTYDDKKKEYGVDLKPLRVEDTAIGMLTIPGKKLNEEANINDYKAIALGLNKEVDKAKAEQAAEAKKTGKPEKELYLVLDINKFDNFLDEIWPPGVQKY